MPNHRDLYCYSATGEISAHKEHVAAEPQRKYRACLVCAPCAVRAPSLVATLN
jgi:hypothetical protein